MTGPASPPLPSALVAAAEQEGRTGWLGTLPATVARLAEAWSLSVGAPLQPGGQTAWVAPVRDRAGAELVLELPWAHPEALHEADGLRAWAGHSTVRLYAAEESADTIGLLLARCRPGTPLTTLPERRQDVIIAGLLRRLWPAPVTGFAFRPLRQMCGQRAAEFLAELAARPGLVDPALAREGIALFRALPASAERRVLRATALHAGSVLAGRAQPWLVIDPRPYVGDPAHDPLQHLLDCELRRWRLACCVQEASGEPTLADVARLLRID